MASTNLGVDGLISGIDTTALIDKLMALERKPLDQAIQRKTELQTRDDAWRDVNTRLYNLQLKVSALKSGLTFNAKQVSLGSNEYFTATAGSSAAAASYQVEVVQLAKAHTVATGDGTVLASANTSLGFSGSFKINDKTIAVTATDTLSSIADKINSTSGVGVTAAVVKMGENNYKLTLTSKNTGLANAITATDVSGDILLNLGILNGTAFAKVVQDAADAVIKVNGLSISRASNTISDVIAGVTLNLKKEGSTGMTVSTDIESVVKAVKDFVDQYNSTMGFIRDALAYDKETQKKGALFGETSLIYLQSEIRGYLSRTVSSVPDEINQLALIGISTGSYNQSLADTKAGNLTLDETKLRKALQDHFDDVAKLFGAKITNVAAAANGGTIIASSQAGDQYPAASLLDGRAGGEDWGNGGGWMGATPLNTPGAKETLEITFAGQKTVDSINLYTLNTAEYPAASYGVRDLTFEYWQNGEWKPLKTAEDPTKNLEVADNVRGVIALNFNPVTTDKIRVTITDSNAPDKLARLTEIEVYQKNEGIFADMYNKLWEITRSGGLISSKRDVIAKEQKANDKRIEDLEDLMKRKEEAYRAKFTAMEKALSKLQTQSSWLSNQIANMPDWYNNKE